MNSRICLLSTTLQATWRMGKEREVFSFQVFDKEKKNFSPFEREVFLTQEFLQGKDTSPS